MVSCKACGREWDRESDLTQHYIKTEAPRCLREKARLLAQLRASRYRARPRQSIPRTAASNHLSTRHSPVDDDVSQPFQGDFFGQNYTEEDFPGFDDARWRDEADEADEGDEESDEDESDTTGAGNHWEPPRHPSSSVPLLNDMNVDNSNPKPPHNNPLLRKLPAHREGIHVKHFGAQAGAPMPGSHRQSSVHSFAQYQSTIHGSEENEYAPFNSKMDWKIGHWAKMRGPGSTAFSELLAIEGVAEALCLSYDNSKDLNKIIDEQIPSRRPRFVREEVVIAGQAFDLYKRDILECIQALYGSPEHAQYLCFTPERHYADADQTQRLYHDFNTGKWWWDTQKAVENDTPGATIIPIILSSDKTQITLFRNKAAYPVYLTIGNLPKEIRRKPSQQGQILLAYLPTTRLEHIKNKAARRRAVTNLFHACMGNIVESLRDAGLNGIVMSSGDGVRRRCHPILAVYVGDYPEQILVTTAYTGDCPVCETERDELGTYPCDKPFRDIEKAVEAVGSLGTREWVQLCLEANIKPVQHPFWENLPYTNIFRSITPDILHQLYQGVMKHLISWLTDITGADEIDARVRRLPPNHTIRIFHKGISSLSRVSGTEHKQMCSFILGVVTDIPGLTAHQSNTLLAATRALLDFLYQACYSIHSTDSLAQLNETLTTFHEHRKVFIDLGVREHFNIPKLHFLCHYSTAIQFYGTTDNYNTETTERLHIDFAKNAYRATNHKDEYVQMTRWLERREKIVYHSQYIEWRLREADPPSPSSITSVQRFDFPGSQRTLPDLNCVFSQKLSRFPTFKSIPVSKLEDPGPTGYNAVHFGNALRRFLVQYRNPLVPRNQLDDWARFVVLPFTSLPVWHKVKFRNTELFGKKTLDSFCAYPRSLNKNGELVKESRFDTVLLKGKDEVSNWVKDTRIGRVRVVFSLPEDKLDTLVPPNVPPPKHLAYVEWFTKLPRLPDSSSGLYQVKRQTATDGTPSASIVSLDSVIRSIHLFPRWGGAVPSEWTSDTVLDLAPAFLLNVFKDEHTYFNLA